MSASGTQPSRRRKVADEDEDYEPPKSPSAAKRTKTTKGKSSPFVSHAVPYNWRRHDPTIARLGEAGEGTVRHFFLQQVALSTHIITWLHKARSPLVDLYFIIMSNLGDQLLYVTLLPWFMWVIDPPFGRSFLLLLITGTTLGNCLKNLLALPRPPSPPLWSHHKHEDFGMPSTHTMNSVSMSMFFAYWLWPMLPEGALWARVLLVMGVLWYTTSMFVSRMYLAAHSHVDTISGFCLGILYFFFWVWAHPFVDAFMNTNTEAPLFVLSVVFVLLLFHPRSSRPSPSYRYSMSLSGLALGMAIGLHIQRFVGPHFWLAPIRSLFSHDFRDSILHSLPQEYHAFAAKLIGVIFGIIILVSTYLLVKFCALILFLVLFRTPPIAYIISKFKFLLRFCALPHPLALDNLDHPQWIEEREIVNPKDAKMLSDMVGTVVVGTIIVHVIPVMLNCMGLMKTSLLAK